MELTLTRLDWIVGCSVLVGSVVVGLYLAFRAHTAENSANFFLAGRKMLWPVIGASFFATNIGAEHLVGLSGDAYRYGICAGTVELTTCICLGFAAAVLFPYFIKTRVFTIPEFLEMRYHPSARVFFAGLMLVICIMTKMAFCLYAGALVLHALFGWGVMSTVIILGFATAIFTIVGGFTAVVYTDTIQAFIMLIGCSIMLFIGLDKVGGFSGLVAKVPEAMSMVKPYDDPNYPFWGIILGAIYGGTFYWGIDQVNVQRVLSAPDLKQARWGAMFAILLKLTPVFLFALPGVIALALFPGHQDESKSTFVILLNDLLPEGIRGMVLAALLAALISSLDSAMNAVSTMVVRDFVLRWRPNTSEKSQVFLGRISILAATALSIGAAYLVYKTPEGIYKYLQTISIYLVMPVTPAIVLGILSKRVTLAGAVTSVCAGVIMAVVFVADQLMGVEAGQRIFPWLHTRLTLNYTWRGLWGTLIILIVLFVVSAFSKKTSPEKLDNTTINWGAKVEKFSGLTDWRLLLTALIVITILIYARLW